MAEALRLVPEVASQDSPAAEEREDSMKVLLILSPQMDSTARGSILRTPTRSSSESATFFIPVELWSLTS